MKPHLKISIAYLLAAFLYVALLLLPLWLQHAPMFVQVPMSILVIVVGLFSAASALRDRWRLSKSTGQFLRYYLRLVAVAIVTFVAIAIIVAILLLGIARRL